MALSKQDFIKQGFESAQMVNGRSPGHEDTMPVFGMGNSWQAKAFAEGFRQGVEARHERNKGLRRGEMVVMTAKTDAGKSLHNTTQSAKKTASLHILSLHSEAGKACEAKDYSRVDRIMRKVEKLRAKWGF